MITYFLIGLTITTFRLVFDITIWNFIQYIREEFDQSAYTGNKLIMYRSLMILFYLLTASLLYPSLIIGRTIKFFGNKKHREAFTQALNFVVIYLCLTTALSIVMLGLNSLFGSSSCEVFTWTRIFDDILLHSKMAGSLGLLFIILKYTLPLLNAIKVSNKTKDAVEDFFDRRWVYNITMILGYGFIVVWLLTLGIIFFWYITGNICE